MDENVSSKITASVSCNKPKNISHRYDFLPGAEMDDMNSLVLPVNTIVSLTAEMQIHNGTKDKQGKPDTDFVSASTVVRIAPYFQSHVMEHLAFKAHKTEPLSAPDPTTTNHHAGL